MSALNLLATITDMEARLAEMRQQLALSLAPAPAPAHYSHPPGFAPRTGFVPRTGFAPHPEFVPRSTVSSTPYPRMRVPYPVNHAPTAIRLQHPQPYTAPARPNPPQTKPFESVPLSAILQPHEVVTVRILLRKEETNHADLVASFDGEHLVVTACELIPTLVGMSVIKPGEILYRFMEELHTAGHLKRMFTVAPWKLCVVLREGVEVTLEELRRQYLAAKNV